MTDKELLEYAAKAAGLPFQYWGGSVHWPHEGFTLLDSSGTPVSEYRWNPLNDDGDALRLAVKLNMGISVPLHKTIKADVIVFTDSSVNIREEGDDPYAATRRAIVRAAAEIGRSME